ncbi:FMN-binding negative transcriptional regulator [Nocardiopsis metallicus]|uniref:FMN-binding negative transcriptional regulator n=1 Tax=Nocardiopsis metallicus TaxID=179819 RepID=UPI003CD077D5
MARGRDFGQLAVNGADGAPPVVVPTRAAPAQGALLVHLARPNPVWRALEEGDPVTFTVIDDYALVPGLWRAPEGAGPLGVVPPATTRRSGSPAGPRSSTNRPPGPRSPPASSPASSPGTTTPRSSRAARPAVGCPPGSAALTCAWRRPRPSSSTTITARRPRAGEVADRLAERRGRGAGAARPAAAPDSGPWPLGKPGLMFSP